jgi:hypothetical protein
MDVKNHLHLGRMRERESYTRVEVKAGDHELCVGNEAAPLLFTGQGHRVSEP